MSQTTPLRWGILGTGNIARQFAEGLATARRGTLQAVGSRAPHTAAAFASAYKAPAAHGTYEDLLSDPHVDVVYNSLPNNLHHHWTIQALRAGKHVLCEKPFAMNAGEAREMIDTARQGRRVLMEAFMYRTHPLTLAVVDAVRTGAIGRVKLIRTSFCYRTNRVEGNVRFDPALGGGAIMDIGCYCVSFARLIAGAEPVSAHAVGVLHPTGVDDYAAGVLKFPGDILAHFACGMSIQADNTAYICGDKGFIEVPIPWKPPASSTFTIARGTPPRMDKPDATKPATPPPPPRQTITVNTEQHLYGIEADAFASAVLDGTPPPVSLDDTLANQRLLDELRRQVGLNY